MSLAIRKSNIEGKGAFALSDFKKGELILKLNLSHLIDNKKPRKKYVGIINGKYYLIQPPERYVNHSCSPNAYIKNSHYIAKRNIKKGEEITEDYTKMDKNFSCKGCNAKNCINIS